jgi:glyoxylase-like metal-dependent hydrolase (beta-lactamase superfamily II)/ferredoxin
MANVERKLPGNVDGDFFVDDSCIDCDQCRRIAPATFTEADEQSVVCRQPSTPTETAAALRALVTCPTASIGTRARHDMRPAIDAYPERIESDVYFCGFAAESSFGASSYLIVRPDGNVLVDSPRFASQLVKRIAAMGGVSMLFLTHQDDVADHAKWAARFGARRILHARDVTGSTRDVEQRLDGDDAVQLGPELLAIPTPGHTAGHTVLLVRERFLFAGDHLWWSPRRQSLWASRDVCWHSWSQQVRSVARLLDYRFEWLLPGHGRWFNAPAGEMRAQLERTLEHLQRQAAV